MAKSKPIKRTIKVDAVNALGFSALMKAAVQGHINCVSTLLEYGANDAIKDSGKGLCAQGWAQYCNRNQVVVQLSQFPREQVGNTNFGQSVHTLWIQNGKSIETKIIHSIRNRARSISKSDGFGVIKALAEETINSSSPFSKIISIV